MFANNSKCVPQVTMYLPHQNVSTWAQTSCQSKPNTSLSKSNSVTRWSFWFTGFFPMWHATPEPTAQSYLQILFDLVVSMFVVLRWYWFLTRPFLSSSCHTFFFFFFRLRILHPSYCSALSPGSLVRLVQTCCEPIWSSHSLFQQSLNSSLLSTFNFHCHIHNIPQIPQLLWGLLGI